MRNGQAGGEPGARSPDKNERVAGCETCGGDGVLIGDVADARGERIDDEVPCPDCTEEYFDDSREAA